ncbi:translation initiation factor IF-6 [Methanothermobacter wolfeii]|uniref:Translation initiation factor 6 n=1 Tax=Methanothermobacter wolfeii TaxID=145261 RepID=A0A9E7RTF0_METWO|nr:MULTISPECIES: translation initiation factor IF-6 [Methanothermobacter]MDI6701910.1 translation initiation factor IF-6 [Methanothermobacter wolfeii]MDI6841355.1 translation initiation factor IF-6 [Methanothermobacter wolfeii]NLM02041.1 translation initiation factor IF-6 [Methanothermobacter wolfeii]QHN05740.1 translation initiation factor IF-6 [Methanothermobacter sp. THM-1]UXH31884.1 translation initiation factor IF-6 [Methanothermobacter wolfeii]
MIRRINLSGNPNLGVYISVTDSVALVPQNTPEKFEDALREALDVEVLRASISGSSLNGALSVGNSNGFIVSNQTMDREIEALAGAGLEVMRIPDRFTAVGNLVLANDNGAVVSPLLSEDSVDVIRKVLEVDVEVSTVAGLNIIGSVGAATNRGALLHPHVSKEEMEIIEGALDVSADVGTVNHGVTLVGACSAANSNGVLVGEETTGPELARIEEALGFLEG